MGDYINRYTKCPRNGAVVAEFQNSIALMGTNVVESAHAIVGISNFRKLTRSKPYDGRNTSFIQLFGDI